MKNKEGLKGKQVRKRKEEGLLSKGWDCFFSYRGYDLLEAAHYISFPSYPFPITPHD